MPDVKDICVIYQNSTVYFLPASMGRFTNRLRTSNARPYDFYDRRV